MPIGVLAPAMCLVIVLVQRVAPFERVWLFLLPLYFAVASGGIARLPGAGRSTMLVGGLLAAVSLGATTLTSGSILSSTETGVFPDAQAVTHTLSGVLASDDAVVTTLPASLPELQYYFAREGMPIDALVRPPAEARNLFVIAAPGASPTVAGWGDPHELQRFPGSVLLMLSRAQGWGTTNHGLPNVFSESNASCGSIFSPWRADQVCRRRFVCGNGEVSSRRAIAIGLDGPQVARELVTLVALPERVAVLAFAIHPQRQRRVGGEPGQEDLRGRTGLHHPGVDEEMWAVRRPGRHRHVRRECPAVDGLRQRNRVGTRAGLTRHAEKIPSALSCPDWLAWVCRRRPGPSLDIARGLARTQS